MLKQTKTIYYVLLGILSLFMLATSFGDLMQVEDIVENITRLGYPATFVPFLGVMKVLAIIVLLFIKNDDLKIAAFAGLTFYGIGAAYAHIAFGDGFASGAPGFVMIALTLGTYFLWKKHQANLQTVQSNN